MTNNEENPQRRKLGVAGWVVLLFMLAALSGCTLSVIYVLVQYANTIVGAS